MHRYYDSMCRDCGDFNYAKREQTASQAREHLVEDLIEANGEAPW